MSENEPSSFLIKTTDPKIEKMLLEVLLQRDKRTKFVAAKRDLSVEDLEGMQDE